MRFRSPCSSWWARSSDEFGSASAHELIFDPALPVVRGLVFRSRTFETEKFMTTGLSLHIDHDRVTDMNGIARALGYASVTLQDSEATWDRVVAEIGKAARVLQRGDIFLLTYSGHGGRQLIDDELDAICSRFR